MIERVMIGGIGNVLNWIVLVFSIMSFCRSGYPGYTLPAITYKSYSVSGINPVILIEKVRV